MTEDDGYTPREKRSIKNSINYCDFLHRMQFLGEALYLIHLLPVPQAISSDEVSHF